MSTDQIISCCVMIHSGSVPISSYYGDMGTDQIISCCVMIYGGSVPISSYYDDMGTDKSYHVVL